MNSEVKIHINQVRDMTGSTFEITIPVLNEESALHGNVLALYDFCMKNFEGSGQWKIVISDNGSIDRTPEIGNNLASKFEQIKYIRTDKRGVGLALRKSWENTSADIIGSMDLDLSADLRHLTDALSIVSEKGYDLVYGTRLHGDSKVTGRSLKREIASKAFNFIIRRYLKVSLSDAMSGFTFFNRSLLKDLVAHGATSDGWFFQAEILIVSEWLGLNVSELPLEWTDDRNSKVKIFPLMLEYLREMRALKKNYYPGRNRKAYATTDHGIHQSRDT
jgi:glycosyltransferase involved in cell wall biosynthesis